jgi:pimeloyl-ACP methyl ester carboxylesterase/predicted nucleic acid-binding Zn ribbon protein
LVLGRFLACAPDVLRHSVCGDAPETGTFCCTTRNKKRKDPFPFQKMIKGALIVVVVVLVAILVCLQRPIVYHASERFPMLPPSAFNLPEPKPFENGLLFTYPGAQVTLVHFHGNGGTVRGSFWHYGRLYNALGVNVAAIEYCGYGKQHTCNQRPTMERILEHARRSLESLGRPSNVMVWLGASLGTAVATQLEYEKHVDGLILENPFTSIADLVWPVPSWLIFDNWAVRMTRVRTLFLTSENDEIVPPHMSQTLAGENPFSTQVILKGCNHGDAPAHPDYLPTIKAFLTNF